MSEERTPQAPAASDDDRFAENMRVLREQRGWSQGEMARQMQRAGWPNFHQTTVSRIEKGERPVRVSEARGIAAVLGSTLDQMIESPATVSKFAEVMSRRADLIHQLRELRQVKAHVFLAQSQFRRVLKETHEDIKHLISDELEAEMVGLLNDPLDWVDPELSDEPPF